MLLDVPVRSFLRATAAAVLALTAASGAAQLPPMPAVTHGPGGEPGMIHTEVFFDGLGLSVELVGGPVPPMAGGGTFGGDVDAPVQMRLGSGFAPPFDVLNGRGFNAQYGWLPSQKPGNLLQDPNALPLDRLVAVELVGLGANNPGPLYAFSGGNGMELINGLHTAAPLFESLGDRFLWDDFVMQHNWYAADAPGLYTATYDVYVADLAGIRDARYTGDTVTLKFNYVPEPAMALLAPLAFALPHARPRRRGKP